MTGEQPSASANPRRPKVTKRVAEAGALADHTDARTLSAHGDSGSAAVRLDKAQDCRVWPKPIKQVSYSIERSGCERCPLDPVIVNQEPLGCPAQFLSICYVGGGVRHGRTPMPRSAAMRRVTIVVALLSIRFSYRVGLAVPG
jgi:hypothetical protein